MGICFVCCFQRYVVFLRLIRTLNPKKKSKLWLKEPLIYFIFFVQVAFLLDTEELPCSEVSVKFLKVITVAFTYGFIL